MDNESGLRDRVALVTGAASGIGRAIAELLAAAGCRIGALDIRSDDLVPVVEGIRARGGQALALVADLRLPAAVAAAADRLGAEYGGIDIVCANAGINGTWAPVDDLEPDEFDEIMAVNLRGTFLTMKYTVPWLRKGGGAVVMTSSVQGAHIVQTPGSVAYAASKAAIAVMARKLALELARDRIRVNSVSPGAIDTPINDRTVRRNLERVKVPVEFPEGTLPLTGGAMIEPVEVAKLVRFLVSHDASFITGVDVVIDAGASLLVA